MPDPTDALSIRMEIKRLLRIAREDFPTFEFMGTVDAEDTAIEALIHPDTFEFQIRLKEGR